MVTITDFFKKKLPQTYLKITWIRLNVNVTDFKLKLSLKKGHKFIKLTAVNLIIKKSL